MLIESHQHWLSNPQEFESLVSPFLMKNEARHCFLLGLLPRLKAGESPFLGLGRAHADAPIRWVAIISPVHKKLFLTEMGPIETHELASRLHRDQVPFDYFNGTRETADAMAAAWVQVTGQRVTLGMQQGLFRLEHLVLPSSATNGTLRPARESDGELALEWAGRFLVEVGLERADPKPIAELAIRERRLFFWEDAGHVVSMAGAAGPTPNGIRINLVYTPPEQRGKGYASHCVAQLTRLLLEQGRKFCFLFTDLSNPTSNSIYKKMGYQQIAEIREYRVHRTS